MQQLVSVDFDGTLLSIIDHEGQKWLTAEEVGQCLGYDESNARKGVLKMFERHGDEFTEGDTTVVKLTTVDRKLRAARVFSATGCIKLGFFASTPRAKDFRAWASKVLAGEQVSAGELTRLRAERDRLRQIALAANPLAVRLMRYRDMGLSLPEIGRLLGITGEAVRHRLKRLAEAGLIDYSPDPRMAAGGRLGQRTRMAQLRANPAWIEQEPAQ